MPSDEIISIVEELENCASVATVVNKWRRLAYRLNLTPLEIQEFENQLNRNRWTHDELLEKILEKWRSRQGRKADFPTFIQALRHVSLNDAADFLEAKFELDAPSTPLNRPTGRIPAKVFVSRCKHKRWKGFIVASFAIGISFIVGLTWYAVDALHVNRTQSVNIPLPNANSVVSAKKMTHLYYSQVEQELARFVRTDVVSLYLFDVSEYDAGWDIELKDNKLKLSGNLDFRKVLETMIRFRTNLEVVEIVFVTDDVCHDTEIMKLSGKINFPNLKYFSSEFSSPCRLESVLFEQYINAPLLEILKLRSEQPLDYQMFFALKSCEDSLDSYWLLSNEFCSAFPNLTNFTASYHVFPISVLDSVGCERIIGMKLNIKVCPDDVAWARSRPISRFPNLKLINMSIYGNNCSDPFFRKKKSSLKSYFNETRTIQVTGQVCI